MSNSIFNMSLPNALRRHAEAWTRVAGYGSVAEYIRDLIRTDQRENPVKNDPVGASSRSTNQSPSFDRGSFKSNAYGRRPSRY